MSDTTNNGGNYGGGGGAFDVNYQGGGGGGLGYKNNIAVTPGNSYTVVVGAAGVSDNADKMIAGDGAKGAVRIIWGAGRSFPSTNTGDI